MRALTAALLLPLTFSTIALADTVTLSESSEQADFDLLLRADGLRNPSSVVFADNGDAYLSGWFGNLWRLDADDGAIETLELGLDLAEGRGFRTVTLHPDFSSNGTLYFCFANGTAERNQTLVARGRLRGTSVTDLQTIFSAENFSRQRLHQSCTIVWDTDSTFLLALGDRYHHLDRAQAKDDYYGVIVRLREDGQPAATVLSENDGASPGVWSYGHRNIQGFTRDPDSGEFWAHEHGPQGGDEINHLRPGLNYGWPAATFGIDYDDTILSETPLLDGTEPPIFYWYPSIAPSGLAIYSGSEFPKWRGDLFLGGLASQRLHRLERLQGRIIREEILLAELDVRIRDVRMSPEGSLYVLTDEENGRLFRLAPTRGEDGR